MYHAHLFIHLFIYLVSHLHPHIKNLFMKLCLIWLENIELIGKKNPKTFVF